MRDAVPCILHNRFYGRIAEQADCHEEGILQAIKRNADGLLMVSGERIWSEVRKILEGRFSRELMKTMLSLGIGPNIGKWILPLIITGLNICSINMYFVDTIVFSLLWVSRIK
jgi:hypothetical protein